MAMLVEVHVHEWYNTLPTSARVVDKLPAPSIDDSGDDLFYFIVMYADKNHLSHIISSFSCILYYILLVLLLL